MRINAFTLLELLIVIILFGVLYSFGFQVYSMFKKGTSERSEKVEVLSEILALKHSISKDFMIEGIVKINEENNGIVILNDSGIELVEYQFNASEVYRINHEGDRVPFFVVGGIESIRMMQLDSIISIPIEVTIWTIARDTLKFGFPKNYSAEELYWVKKKEEVYVEE